jgi:hypothetical protein
LVRGGVGAGGRGRKMDQSGEEKGDRRRRNDDTRRYGRCMEKTAKERMIRINVVRKGIKWY